MSGGCKHKETTVSVVYKNETMTRRCDTCKMLIGTFYAYDWRLMVKPQNRESK